MSQRHAVRQYLSGRLTQFRLRLRVEALEERFVRDGRPPSAFFTPGARADRARRIAALRGGRYRLHA